MKRKEFVTKLNCTLTFVDNRALPIYLMLTLTKLNHNCSGQNQIQII